MQGWGKEEAFIAYFILTIILNHSKIGNVKRVCQDKLSVP